VSDTYCKYVQLYNGDVRKIHIDLKQASWSFGEEVFYNNFIQFGVPIELFMLIKLYLNYTYSKVRTDKHMSAAFLFTVVLYMEMLHFLMDYCKVTRKLEGKGSI
jgi:hypothetical protein